MGERDRPASEVDVTEEMLNAGMRVLDSETAQLYSEGWANRRSVLSDIYLAMHASRALAELDI